MPLEDDNDRLFLDRAKAGGPASKASLKNAQTAVLRRRWRASYLVI